MGSEPNAPSGELLRHADQELLPMKDSRDSQPGPPHETSSWKDLLLAALMEMDPAKLPDKIAQARAAIDQRADELAMTPSAQKERNELRDGIFALQNLRNVMRSRSSNLS
jgi:hypothetical protein